MSAKCRLSEHELPQSSVRRAHYLVTYISPTEFGWCRCLVGAGAWSVHRAIVNAGGLSHASDRASHACIEGRGIGEAKPELVRSPKSSTSQLVCASRILIGCRPHMVKTTAFGTTTFPPWQCV
jgi:hypothetical protein